MLSLAVASSLCVGMLIESRPAEAGYEYYCGSLVDSRGWCYGPYREIVTWNRAQYPGSGDVWVDIQFYTSFSKTYSNQYGGWNYVAHGISPGRAGQPMVGNGSPNRHTINGRMDVCVGCLNARLVDEGLANIAAPKPLAILMRSDLPAAMLSPTSLMAVRDSDYALDANRARLAFIGDRGDAYVVVPGVRTCLFRESADRRDTVAACSTDEQIASGHSLMIGARTEDLTDGQVRIAGLAPDGVTAVRVELVAGGPAIDIPVTNNVFVAETAGRADREPAAVSYIYGDGGHGATDPTGETPVDEAAGGCSTGGSAGGGGALLLAIGALLVKRRRV